ncbi:MULTISPECIES: sensor histidine kinase [unclassified Rhizobium]|uniref:sensor histidine kinase n=1 Tax=unclassified Rhizobium TaxID=2613769 RepID=UPI0017CD6C64|nr:MULTISPECIES: sensor histidine kinase [unclassified Rhizobium]MBB3542244.1 two-component system C4-dicarboxylate transport sensor histidine kinase DctB [Rhizobium sp. BK399]MCS3738103.1 two-component system C4-dicarboxylate transport sensor histidine kinase DctB [Rhizobium sp. BK661]MCS4092951.1 two-component system C4-dicarboxylate transport sensor histidine kinase DctB [Rhizobium sp. BK176]
MKQRFRVLVGLCLLSAACYAAISSGREFATRSYMNEASLQAGSALRLAVSALAGHLSRYEPLPELIADHDNIKQLVNDPGNEALRSRANTYLKEINSLLESSDIYVMRMNGDTIAASNYDGPTSFVGENFSYRPYFQDAARGSQARFYALGTTSLKRGYYFASPIQVNGTVRGVIVFKVDIDSIEGSWKGGEYKILVSDPEGIIFMTGSPEWLYSSVLPLTEERLRRTQASRRYAEAVLRPLPISEQYADGHRLLTVADGAAPREYLTLSHYMRDADWTVSVLMDTSSVHAQARTMLIAVLLSIGLMGLVVAIVLQRRARAQERMRMQIDARNELEERVEERTAALAHVNQRIEEEIAERRLTEQKLRQTQADLIQAGKLAGLGQMSAALSHELNQPLAAAKTYVDSAAMLIARDRVDEARDNLSRISGLIDRMASISRHLRNFARKPNEKVGPVSLATAIADTLEIVSARLKVADATLVIDLGEPSAAVQAGSVRLQQVLVNIITNAADAVEGLDDRRIHVVAVQDGAKMILTVRDHGPGVSPAIAERIFDPFFSTKGVGRGLGLGLSISYNIIKDFGGTLSVSNAEDGGAEFRIVLDAAPVVSEAAE